MDVPGPHQLSMSITKVVIDAPLACSKAALSTLLSIRPHLDVVFPICCKAKCLYINNRCPEVGEVECRHMDDKSVPQESAAAAVTKTGGLIWPLLYIVLFGMFLVLLICFLRYIIANKPIDIVVPRVSCETCLGSMKSFIERLVAMVILCAIRLLLLLLLY
uniref:Uncharacterized protein n=1 Tax=Plectus sambesii TaxID=2011161 RepID=A0A914VWJ0_9BILA